MLFREPNRNNVSQEIRDRQMHQQDIRMVVLLMLAAGGWLTYQDAKKEASFGVYTSYLSVAVFSLCGVLLLAEIRGAREAYQRGSEHYLSESQVNRLCVAPLLVTGVTVVLKGAEAIVRLMLTQHTEEQGTHILQLLKRQCFYLLVPIVYKVVQKTRERCARPSRTPLP